MKTSWRLIGPAVLFAVALAACSESSGDGRGVTSPQPPGACLDQGSACTADQDCCSQSCVSSVCAKGQQLRPRDWKTPYQ
jgi:hypothetical protein